MDLDGAWRAPQEWPEDTPPLDGWLRSSDGSWHAPSVTAAEQSDIERRSIAVIDEPTPPVVDNDEQPRRSRQAEADRKAMFTVAGVIAAGLMVLVAVLVLITQAGAEDIPEDDTATEDSVVFAAETDEVRMQRRLTAAADAPATARAMLALLDVRSPSGNDDVLDGFDLLEWTAERTDCLDIAEQVLVDRSLTPIQWADQLECVPDRGRWVDRYLGSTITRTLDADVTLHVPSAVAYVSGGADWTPATRQAYLTDIDHPASLEVTSAGSGHNPRGHDPSLWKPSAKASWCAYAIDWIAVKDRWEMSVTGTEQASLTEMLQSCATATSAGPDLQTMVIDDIAPATIERIEGASE